mmetsp:Transcript_1025/g.3279  ORF Transcript_1025/g.3279 Transcript_1025/m.3279 type:complete len:224 (+) Transcript_1025:396-1067(+)
MSYVCPFSFISGSTAMHCHLVRYAKRAAVRGVCPSPTEMRVTSSSSARNVVDKWLRQALNAPKLSESSFASGNKLFCNNSVAQPSCMNSVTYRTDTPSSASTVLEAAGLRAPCFFSLTAFLSVLGRLNNSDLTALHVTLYNVLTLINLSPNRRRRNIPIALVNVSSLTMSPTNAAASKTSLNFLRHITCPSGASSNSSDSNHLSISCDERMVVPGAAFFSASA